MHGQDNADFYLFRLTLIVELRVERGFLRNKPCLSINSHAPTILLVILVSLVPIEVNLSSEGNKNQCPKGPSPDEEEASTACGSQQKGRSQG